MAWATALGKSEGFSRPIPSIVFAVALVASMAGLAIGMRELPVSTSYAVWVGIGTVLTAAYAMVFDGEQFSLVRILLLLGIVGCAIAYWRMRPIAAGHLRQWVSAVVSHRGEGARNTETPLTMGMAGTRPAPTRAVAPPGERGRSRW